MTTLTESEVEQAALDWQVAHGPDIAPGTLDAGRHDYGQVALERRLRDAPPPAPVRYTDAKADVRKTEDR